MTESYKFTRNIGDKTVEIIQGDITLQDTEAIVNAANKKLTPGSGVSGAIHAAAGDELWEECKKAAGCETGQAKLTAGYNLKAKYVIHTVGPVYNQNFNKDKELLRAAYYNSLKLADEKGIKSISFPAISTGIFGYPVEDAAVIAINTIVDFLKEHEGVKAVRMVLYDRRSREIHKRELDRVINE